VSTIEELLERKSRGSGLEDREYGRGDPSRCPRGTLYPQKFDINLAYKRRLLGLYSSLADTGHGDFFYVQRDLFCTLNPVISPEYCIMIPHILENKVFRKCRL
jgi:hypothetical protein